MSLNKKIIFHAVICSMIFFILLMPFVSLNYIDFSVIKSIYLPIYGIVMIAFLFQKYIFGYIFTISAVLGLITEYIIYLSQVNPTMRGAFLNTLIIFLGFAIGVITQIIVKRTKDRTNIL